MITIYNLEEMTKSLYMTRYSLSFDWYDKF